MNYITRNIETRLHRFIDSPDKHKNVLLVEGARQVGKSTVVEHVINQFPIKKSSISRCIQQKIYGIFCNNFYSAVT